ncbi:hypothetical protein [Haloferax sp. ATB1]|nr:hypothetical protein [Haloferax sp. ATB1]
MTVEALLTISMPYETIEWIDDAKPDEWSRERWVRELIRENAQPSQEE